MNYRRRQHCHTEVKNQQLGVVLSVHSATQSYTIDVAVSMDGRLANKLYICLQETQGDVWSAGCKETSSNLTTEHPH